MVQVQLATNLVGEVEGGKQRATTSAELLGRHRKLRAAIERLLLRMQQVEADTLRMIRRLRSGLGQYLGQRPPQSQTRPVNTSLHGRLFDTQNLRHLGYGQLGNVLLVE